MNNPVNAATILLDICDGVALITLNRPARRNAFDMPMRDEFARTIDACLTNDSVKVMVLTGSGGHFCAGGDVSTMPRDTPMSAETGRKRMRDLLQVIERLHNCDKPLLSAVDGCAFGGGFGLALLADMVLVTPGARFCMSFMKVGLMPDTASMYTLPRIVGLQRARELIFSGREIDGQTALEYGIAMEVIEPAHLLARALEIAGSLTSASSAALGMAKTALNQSLSSSLRTMMEFEAAAQGIAFSTPYHREAIGHLLDREPTAFQWKPKRQT